MIEKIQKEKCLGLIELSTNIDRQLIKKHTMHSRFESDSKNGLPVMKISKELRKR